MNTTDSARRAAEEICAYFGDTELAMGGHVNANGVAAIISKHFAAAQPAAIAGRVVNISTHGEPTRARLREVETSVSNGYEREYRKSGWSKALQFAIRDLHFLLTFFQDDVAAAAPADNDAESSSVVELRSACCSAPTQTATTDYNVCTACKEPCETTATTTKGAR